MTNVLSSQEPVRIPLDLITDNPFQVRRAYSGQAVEALAVSIRDLGLLHVPLARKVGDAYQLAFGHRRKAAFELLTLQGLEIYEEMPLRIQDLSDREMIEASIAENLKREDLSPIEKGELLQTYMSAFDATSAQAAELFGIPESTIRGTVRLLKLPEEAKQKVGSGELSQRQARKILQKPDTEPRRIERSQHFDLRAQLIILLYETLRSDINDQLIFKRVKGLVEENAQLRRQVELMNSERHNQAKPIPAGYAMQRASISSR